MLNVVLHQEGLLSLMAFSQSVMDTINEITETKGRPTARSNSKTNTQSSKIKWEKFQVQVVKF